MKKNKPDAWDLFHSMFEDGEEVVIITDEEEFFYGFLKTTDIHCVLEKSNKNPIEIEWDEVRFISHDGFPVKKLRGADGSALITYLDTTDTQKAIREALEIKFGVCDLCSKKAILHKVKYEAIHRRDGSRIEWRDKIRLECNDCNKDVKHYKNSKMLAYYGSDVADCIIIR